MPRCFRQFPSRIQPVTARRLRVSRWEHRDAARQASFSYSADISIWGRRRDPALPTRRELARAPGGVRSLVDALERQLTNIRGNSNFLRRRFAEELALMKHEPRRSGRNSIRSTSRPRLRSRRNRRRDERDAVDDSRAQRARTIRMRELARKGGLAVKSKKPPQYHQQLGRLGGIATAREHSSDAETTRWLLLRGAGRGRARPALRATRSSRRGSVSCCRYGRGSAPALGA
jgi:hypothetical protein